MYSNVCISKNKLVLLVENNIDQQLKIQIVYMVSNLLYSFWCMHTSAMRFFVFTDTWLANTEKKKVMSR